MTVDWKSWVESVAACVASVPDETLKLAADFIRKSTIVITAGNGGSASLASHAAQAIAKPSYGPNGGLAAVCLTDHVPTLTAHANDGSWDDAMVNSAMPFLRTGCTLVVFSSSGRSANVCKLARLVAADATRTVIAFTGFDGNPLRGLATIPIHVPSHDYEVVEPVHEALMHRVQYHIRESSP